MADDIDRAQEINEQFQADALARARRSYEQRPSLSHCKDCGDQIPLRRQLAIPGVQRCVGCQEIHDNWRPL